MLADARQLCHQRHVNVVGDVHGLEVGVVFDQRQLGFESLWVGHDVFYGLQLGHVHAGFGRHVQLGVAGAQARFLVAGNGAADAALAPVVGCQRQVPVTKHAVQLLQVIEGRAGRGQHIAPVIAKDVLLEIEIVARGGHELPHARSLGGRNGLGVERAFDVGQQCQFGGHAPALQLFYDVKEVFAGALGHALHVVGAAGIPLLTVLHQLVLQVGHGKATADAIPKVGRGEQGSHLAAAHFGGGDGLQWAAGDDGGGVPLAGEWGVGVGREAAGRRLRSTACKKQQASEAGGRK